MGISYNAVVIVGLPVSEMNNLDMVEEWIDEDKIDWVQPYYDAPIADSICGFVYVTSQAYSFCELDLNEDKEETLRQQFVALTGQRPEVFISVDAS